jgi:hypothetical protein
VYVENGLISLWIAEGHQEFGENCATHLNQRRGVMRVGGSKHIKVQSTMEAGMKRAAIIIGVNRVGNLPGLKDAARGAHLMEKWAKAQRMNAVQVFTDEVKPVDVSQIKKAIKRLVNDANLNQLVIYFAGHGVNKQRHEYWLLSDAADDTQAAVNVAGSVGLASTCGIEHIVLISDACRTAAEGIRAQSVEGSEIFPNRENDEKPVDQFFACQLGRPSYEVKDPEVTSAEFKALYTSELVPALLGQRAQVVEWTTRGPKAVGLVHLRPLRDFLSSAVTSRLKNLKLQSKVIQVPTAYISSDPPTWISRVSPGSKLGFSVTPPGTAPPDQQDSETMEVTISPRPAKSTATITATLLQSALANGSSGLLKEFERNRISGIPGAEDLITSAERIAQPFGPVLEETKCGFKIRGSQIVEAYSRNATTQILDSTGPRGEVVRVNSVSRTGASVLLLLEEGTAVCLPAIPDFLASLTIEEGELVEVAYEPSANTSRWAAFHDRAAEIRALRAVASSSMTRGVFRLEGEDSVAVAKRMQYAKGVDPSLAIYAAYAYNDLQRLDLIRQMSAYLQSDLGAPLFDVALLSRKLNGRKLGVETELLSFVPMLAQGWAFLSAYNVSLPSSLDGLQQTLVPSLWTLFNRKGWEIIRQAMNLGEIR